LLPHIHLVAVLCIFTESMTGRECQSSAARFETRAAGNNRACRPLGRTQTAALAPRAMFAGLFTQAMLEVDFEECFA
jgi:hypothetical protein